MEDFTSPLMRRVVSLTTYDRSLKRKPLNWFDIAMVCCFVFAFMMFCGLILDIHYANAG